MCEITSDNFDAKFQEISYNLQKANYIAIDTEFTGLHIENSKPNLTDTVEQRYLKTKRNIQTFSVVQIGLCTFRYCSDQKIFITDTYNFYLFPRSCGYNNDQNSFLQTSAVEFLCKYDFDFNKLVYKGISYLNNKQEKQLEAKMNKHLFFAGIERDIDEKLLQKICSEVTDWLLHATVGECFELTEIKGLQDFIIHRELRNRFSSIWTHQEGSLIIVERISKKKRDELNKSDSSNEVARMIDIFLGFTKIFRLIVQYKKPLIFHNGYSDLLFMYEKFYEPLPDTYAEFKRNINELFPLIYDTKHMSLASKKVNRDMKDMFDSTVLESLFNSLSREVSKKCALYMPSIKHSAASADYALKARPHEAGYDAFMTGSIFLKLAHAISHFDSKNCYNIRANNMNDYFLVVRPFENRINLIKASLDHVNLSGPDPDPFKLNTFIVTTKLPALSLPDLVRDFSALGDVEVLQISKKCARVTVDSYASERLVAMMKNHPIYEFTSSMLERPPLSSYLFGLGLASIGLLFLLKKSPRFF